MGNLNQKALQRSVCPSQEEEKSVTCEICIEPITPPNNKFRNGDKCVHHFCTDCIIKYIKVKLEDNVSDIKCPANACANSLDPLSCKPKISKKLFDRWCHALCESTVLGVRRIFCPNKKCSELILNECGDGNLKRCLCPGCKTPFCFRCKVPWHDSSTCVENEDEDENDIAFDLLYTANKWKRCPKCGHCIENVGNCTVIHCRCGFKFCYYCENDVCLQLNKDLGKETTIVALILAVEFLAAFCISYLPAPKFD